MKPGIYEMEASRYYADPCAVPSLTQSTARVLLNASPAHAWAEHPKGGGLKRTPTAAMDEGQIVDSLLLGGKDIKVFDVDEFRTKEAREARDAAIEEGKTPVSAKKYAYLKRASDILRDKLGDAGVSFDKVKQPVLVWESDGVLCRCRMDHLDVDGCQIDDLKTTESANPIAFARKAFSLGYDIQAAAYLEAAETVFPDLAGRFKYRLAVCELEPPFAICPTTFSGAFLSVGRERWKRAKEIWRECLKSGKWPEYQPAILEPPPWAMAEAIEAMGVSENVQF